MTDPIDYENLQEQLAEHRVVFERGTPFPHIIIDEFLQSDAATGLLAEFSAPPSDGGGWNEYTHYNERKSALTRFDAMGKETRAIIDEMSSERFLNWLSEISGIEGLLADPDLDGGGLHEMKPGGFLNMHTDFLSHTKRPHWRRELNLLLYVNQDWQEEWEGKLELWDDQMKIKAVEIVPVFNRCVIFRTSEKSYHGNPIALACPKGVTRKSLALYYFRDEGKPLKLQPTHYKARPNEPVLKHALVAIDRWLVRAYSILKRYTPMNDRLLSWLMRWKSD